jgi:serine/threonine protein phosphatase PrpC
VTDLAPAPVTACPSCGAAVAAADRFCESCGTPLHDGAGQPVPAVAAVGPGPAASATVTPHPAASAAFAPDSGSAGHAPVCGTCGDPFADGWCTGCGAPEPDPRDHVQARAAAWVAGVSDRGRRHPHNQDAMALAVVGQLAVLVVCDGVTTATASEVAALDSATAARDVLAAAIDPADPAGADQWLAHLVGAGAAALAAAVDVAARVGTTPDPPACTFVAAVTDGRSIAAANIGDSRAYWLPDGHEPVQLGTDHSWASERIAQGIAREVAENEPDAHAITRWLGIDAPPGDASCTTAVIDGSGWLLVCSDGLWNYASEPSALRAVLDEQAATVGADPLDLAEALVAWANERGGQDNITVTLARIDPHPIDAHPPAPPPEP